jgi:hypothetical protein
MSNKTRNNRMPKQTIAKRHRENRFYEDHQENVRNCMRLITDWMMMITVVTVIMRMTSMIIANREVLDTLCVNNSV